MKTILVQTMLIMALFLWGCNIITEASGSFEEMQISGRLQGMSDDDDPNAKYRFFRFHLRQFDTTIGGTFETFDLKSYASFSSMPKQVSTYDGISENYYCSRIDYGYTRDDQVHIVFTDREQRQWIYRAKLGEETLHGSLSRMQFNMSQSIPIDDLDYLLAEDAQYYKENKDQNMDALMNNQIVLSLMDKSSDRSLQCIYYYRKNTVTFSLPETLDLESLCSPSVSHCNNLRLAVIGSIPVMHPKDVFNRKELFSASLDDCDINNRTRTLFLRDNPFTLLRISRDNRIPFIATAILYEDGNGNGSWDREENEKIYAALADQILVFYKNSSDSDEAFSIYGMDENAETLNTPTFTQDTFGSESGWFTFSENIQADPMFDETPNHTTPFYRPVQSVNRIDNMVMRLQAIEGSSLGCYVDPNNNKNLLPRCKRVFPILIQK